MGNIYSSGSETSRKETRGDLYTSINWEKNEIIYEYEIKIFVRISKKNFYTDSPPPPKKKYLGALQPCSSYEGASPERGAWKA
jgi:hypothetical protein